jgi:hypothetical protein
MFIELYSRRSIHIQLNCLEFLCFVTTHFGGEASRTTSYIDTKIHRRLSHWLHLAHIYSQWSCLNEYFFGGGIMFIDSHISRRHKLVIFLWKRPKRYMKTYATRCTKSILQLFLIYNVLSSTEQQLDVKRMLLCSILSLLTTSKNVPPYDV